MSAAFLLSYAAIDRGELVYRLTVEALVDVKRCRKPHGSIAKEARAESAELDLAPLGDPLPSDWGQP
jgi:hypothetical protein